MIINTRMPLVSIMIPNYNHSRYLDQCIGSALRQTYPNIEVILLDNQSTDDSIKTASKYIRNNVRVCRNCHNTLNYTYRILAEHLASGSYMMLLGADDYLYEYFVKKAVDLMEQFPNVGYVHGEREFVTEEGSVIQLDPFYRSSFIAPGRNDSPVYMVTTVAHSSQGIFRRSAFEEADGYDRIVDHMNVDRALWFYLSQVSDYGYIRDTSAGIRVGDLTETRISQSNFQHPILCHLTVKEFVKHGRTHNLPRIYEREQEALNRLARECLLDTASMIRANNWEAAITYLKYCKILDPEIEKDEKYVHFEKMCKLRQKEDCYLQAVQKAVYDKVRSYDPPEGFCEIIYNKETKKWIPQK